MLVLRGVRCQVAAQRRLQFPDLALRADEHCLIAGASGSGKTTLLHALAGIVVPDAGTIELDGRSLVEAARDDRWRGRHIGVVPQKLHLLASLDALDNVRLAQWLAGRRDDAAARELLVELGLGDALQRRPAALSLGEQQRVAIARAVVNRPRLLLADEPTSSLDDDSAAQAAALLFAAARRSGALLVVASHDARLRDGFAQRVTLRRESP